MISRNQRLDLPTGGCINVDLDAVPMPPRHLASRHRGFIITSGPVAGIHVGAIFDARRCTAVCGPCANGSTARLQARKWVDAHTVGSVSDEIAQQV